MHTRNVFEIYLLNRKTSGSTPLVRCAQADSHSAISRRLDDDSSPSGSVALAMSGSMSTRCQIVRQIDQLALLTRYFPLVSPHGIS